MTSFIFVMKISNLKKWAYSHHCFELHSYSYNVGSGTELIIISTFSFYHTLRNFFNEFFMKSTVTLGRKSNGIYSYPFSSKTVAADGCAVVTAAKMRSQIVKTLEAKNYSYIFSWWLRYHGPNFWQSDCQTPYESFQSQAKLIETVLVFHFSIILCSYAEFWTVLCNETLMCVRNSGGKKEKGMDETKSTRIVQYRFAISLPLR